MNFQDQTILITGGAQGIGKSIVQSFLNLNAKVIALDIDPIEKTLFDHHENLDLVKLDLSLPEKMCLLTQTRVQAGSSSQLVSSPVGWHICSVWGALV